MAFLTLDPNGKPIISSGFLFDVDGHKLSLATFLETSKEFERLIESLNQELFEGKLQYKVYVFAPEQGSFRSNLGVVIVAGFGALTATIFGDFGSGLFEGLTGHPPGEWGEQIGNDLRESLLNRGEHGLSDQSIEDAVSTEILVAYCEKILSSRTESLVRCDFPPEQFPDVFSAKNAFFESLEINPQVRSISIGSKDPIPVSRDEFALRVTPVPTTDATAWVFETRKIFVTSPNWDRHDKHRGWKGRDSTGATVFFQILDDMFWARFDHHEIRSETIDELILQFACRVQNGRTRNRYALNIISYNGKVLSKEISPQRLREILEETGLSALQDDQSELFTVD